ncbi:MAG: tRNA uridine-5-carboxymethylaminomethyl(34) synthesis GTPase MnmE [Chromatiales bacterium]|nr:tRNA uridine-5-carboxymethylaminomethyl(34) synthesis GTPase MnmE [Chromatiales bacterium]
MSNSPTDTITAIATPSGRGAVGIVRVSGPNSAGIARALLGRLPAPRKAHFGPFLDADGQPLDHGIAIWFPGPASFTGEDVLELQGHGGPIVLDLLLQRALSLGARAARPGEFSERAFVNGKIDLAQAEAIADLIDASTRQAALAAVRSLQGEFSEHIHNLVDELIRLRTFVEASLDFSDEDIDFLTEGHIAEQVHGLRKRIAEIQKLAGQGRILRDGIHVVLAGRPNAGKSTLLNRLAGRESAIVTDIPGTTRDILREPIQLEGVPLHLVDTAGLREDSIDPVEQEGVRRARREIEQADRILLLVDDNDRPEQAEAALLADLPQQHARITVLRTKIDRSGHAPALSRSTIGERIHLSAHTGAGMELLRNHLLSCVGYQAAGEHSFMARRRHLDALSRAQQTVVNAETLLVEGHTAELVAEELRAAQESLSEITGQFTSDDLLGKIFSSFCIGK